MGKGDKKSKRGKITLGTFGARRRPRKNNRTEPAAIKQETFKIEKEPEVKPVPPKKKLKTNAH